MNAFQILTPLTYWLLMGLWVSILRFLLRRLSALSYTEGFRIMLFSQGLEHSMVIFPDSGTFSPGFGNWIWEMQPRPRRKPRKENTP